MSLRPPTPPPAEAGPPARRPPRRSRLPPEVRVPQILDAALGEFSRRGFHAARMDDIARQARLSKGGLYAHFASKEALFSALLLRTLTPVVLLHWEPSEQLSLHDMVTEFVDQTFERLCEPRVLATLRLLIAETARMPQLARDWRDQVLRAQIDRHRAWLDDCVARGLLRRSALNDHPALLFAPAMQATLWLMVFGVDDAEPELGHMRQAHVHMLMALLQPEAA